MKLRDPKKGTGTFCAKHPKGLPGKRCLAPFSCLAWIACLLLGAAGSDAAELRSGPLTVRVERHGCGFVDEIALAGRPIVKAPPDFAAARVKLAAAGDGTADSLFPNRLAAVLAARISSLSATGGRLAVEGAYTDGTLRVPFTRELVLRPEENAVAVRETVDFGRLPAEYVLAGHALELPLVLSGDEHSRMFAFGGVDRAETFRMDMNDERRRNQLISCSRAFQPYWDIGGVLQLPGSYRIWRANHADTMAYPIEQRRGAPGWADYSELDVGITVRVLDPRAAAPWAMQVDARRGVFGIAPHPAGQMPVSGKDLGRREFRFLLLPHESSWPATLPCELDFEGYKRLLAYLNRGDRFTNLDDICRQIGIAAPEGKKTPQQLDEVSLAIIFKERIQPSVLLRILYRGDAWRMAGLVKELLGRQVPRNQPLEKWNAIARELLDKIKTREIEI